MLEIFNNLGPFCEDVFREFSVREYARARKISPPTSSSVLKGFVKEGMFLMREERNLLLFRANRESALFRDLHIAYWRFILKKALEPLLEKILFRKIMLFGSIAKAENKIDSDLDLFVDVKYLKLDTSHIEKALKRKIQIHFSDSLKNEHLKANIEKGVEI